ncbi:MAG: ferritin family protein, partial [Kiritimatiellaeota bacterium]|nr:ferritin family protein [Kiritimatiellota bacterium]
IGEVFEIAERIERNGYAFYVRAAEIMTGESSKKFLLDLAEMENDHESLFVGLKNKFAADGVESPFDGDDLALSYLRSMVDGEVFSNLRPIAESLTGTETADEIKKLAMEFEKNTVVYFASLANAMKSDKDKDIIQRLVGEEIQHIAILTNWQTA